MSETLITPGHARQLAKDLFLEAFVEAGQWFEIAWEAASENCGEANALPDSFANALGVSDGINPAIKEMARDFAVLFETFLQKHPITQEALVERLESSCLRNGKSPQSTVRLTKILKKTMLSQAPFVIWTGMSSTVGVTTEYSSSATVDAYLATESDFDIFVHGKRISIQKENARETLDLPPRLYWLLIMLLRYRGRELPVEETFRKAWDRLELLPGESREYILQEHLRFAISTLRDRLEPLTSIRKIGIPRKTNDAVGYRCEGKFSFCIILDRDLESRVTLKVT